MFLIVQVSPTGATDGLPVRSKVIARVTLATTRKSTCSGALVTRSRRKITKVILPSATVVRLGALIGAEIATRLSGIRPGNLHMFWNCPLLRAYTPYTVGRGGQVGSTPGWL